MACRPTLCPPLLETSYIYSPLCSNVVSRQLYVQEVLSIFSIRAHYVKRIKTFEHQVHLKCFCKPCLYFCLSIRTSLISMYVCMYVLGDPEVTPNLYCNFAYLYWEGCVICMVYICGNFWIAQYVYSLNLNSLSTGKT